MSQSISHAITLVLACSALGLGCAANGPTEIELSPADKADGTLVQTLVFASEDDAFVATAHCNEWISCDAKFMLAPRDLDVIRHASSFFASHPNAQTYDISLAKVTLQTQGQSTSGYFGAYAVRDASAAGGVRVWASSQGPTQPEYLAVHGASADAVIKFRIEASDVVARNGWLPMELSLDVRYW